MNLNIGCGGSRYSFFDLKCEVNCDVSRPTTEIPNFILGDICNLPFKEKAFETVYAYNVLEHLKDYRIAAKELDRVSRIGVIVRYDKMYNLANWLTSDHESMTVSGGFKSFPKPMKRIIMLARTPIDRSANFQKLIHLSFPYLRKLGLLDTWGYRRLK